MIKNIVQSCTLQKLDENKRPDDQRKSEKKVSFSSDVPLASMGNSGNNQLVNIYLISIYYFIILLFNIFI